MSKKDDDSLDIKPEVEPLKEKTPEGDKDLAAKLAECEKKAQENWDIALRTRAELENMQKRATRDVEQAHKYALEQFSKALLPVVDSLERGLEATETGDQSVDSIRQGMELTLKLTLDTLKKFSIEQLDPTGQPFDPSHHEAMTMQPSPDVAANTVMQVIQKGYLLHGRLLRPAQVIVSSGKS